MPYAVPERLGFLLRFGELLHRLKVNHGLTRAQFEVRNPCNLANRKLDVSPNYIYYLRTRAFGLVITSSWYCNCMYRDEANSDIALK